jgi:hypothetical protein
LFQKAAIYYSNQALNLELVKLRPRRRACRGFSKSWSIHVLPNYWNWIIHASISNVMYMPPKTIYIYFELKGNM